MPELKIISISTLPNDDDKSDFKLSSSYFRQQEYLKKQQQEQQQQQNKGSRDSLSPIKQVKPKDADKSPSS